MTGADDRRDAPPAAPAEVFHGDEIDETFDGRLRQAIVRHFRFEWRELLALRQRSRASASAPVSGPVSGPSDAAGADPPPGTAS